MKAKTAVIARTLPDRPAQTPAEDDQLMSAAGLLPHLFPDEISRPCMRWLRELQAKRLIPFIKIGNKVLFQPTKVRAALERFEVSAR